MNRTGLRLNILSGLVSSFWAVAAAIIVVPLYLAALGAASFGLVMFSTTLLGLFAILDLGFATSINREVAQAGARDNPAGLRDLLRTLASTYWLVAAVAGAATFIAAGPIARTFLTSPAVDPATVVAAVRIMAVMVVFRLPAGIYMGVLMGGQRIAAANATVLVITTLSTFGALAALSLTGGGILTFLTWQAIVAAVNVAALGWMAWRIVPGERRPRFSGGQIRAIWRFTSLIALTTVIGALLLQADKLVLARFAPLEIVGRYGLAGFPSRALLLLVGAIFSALYPRLTEMLARGDRDMLIDFYRQASRALACVLAAATTFLAVNARDVFYVWTGSATISGDVGHVAAILLVGTALNGIMYMPHAVQLAFGNARIAFWNNVAMIAFLAPALFLLVPTYGMTGAALGWLGANVVNLLAGTWLTHRALLPGLARRWLVVDVLVPSVAAGTMPCAGAWLLPVAATVAERLALGAVLSAAGLALALALIFVPGTPRRPWRVVSAGQASRPVRSASTLDR